jgi:DNA-binding CsgD family transcriptional regulator
LFRQPYARKPKRQLLDSHCLKYNGGINHGTTRQKIGGGIMAGRKPKTLTAEQKAEVETLAALLSQEQIADYFGVTRPTFTAMMARDEEISLRYKRGKARAIGAVAKGLLQRARDGDTASAIFYLKTQAGWRETHRIEGPGENGEHLHKVSPDEAFERLASRLGGFAPGSTGGDTQAE